MAEVESALREDIKTFLSDVPCHPLLVRLAWHDAGTYNHEDKTGGANASIRFEPEILHGANNGLKKAVDFLEPFHAKYPAVSYADLYQLASVVAIEAAGGPVIPFRFGRIDSEACTEDGRLPDATKRMPHLRDVFYRMGFGDKEIVVLSGAHALGSAHKERSGFNGPWTTKPLVFDNEYYQNIIKGDTKGLLLLDSDKALCDEPELEKLVTTYAEDQDAFFADYIEAHKKLSELGFPA